MYVRLLSVELEQEPGQRTAVPVQHIDSFAMRNFTNEAVFDDTLPLRDGRMEAGLLVPLEELQEAMADWFLRKGYRTEQQQLKVEVLLSE